MKKDSFDRSIGKISRMLETRAGSGRGPLAKQLRRADHCLSPAARNAGAELVKAQKMIAHPRLRHRVNGRVIRREERRLTAYLLQLDPWDRRKGVLISILASISAALLLSGALVLVLLYWRGFI